MIQKYCKIPVEIEAIQFTRNNFAEVHEFLGESYGGVRTEKRIDGKCELHIKTLEDGSMYQVEHIASEGDFIIKGVKGEFYACKPDIFNLTYKLILSDIRQNIEMFANWLHFNNDDRIAHEGWKPRKWINESKEPCNESSLFLKFQKYLENLEK